MSEQENNQEVLNTSEEAVVTQIEMEATNSGSENSIEPTEITKEVTEEEIMPTEALENAEPEFETEQDAVSEIVNEVETFENTESSVEQTEELIQELSKEDKATVSTPNAESIEKSVEPLTETIANIHDDEDMDEESKMMDAEEAINIDYSAYTKSQLLTMALDATQKMVAREAVKKIQNIRPFFDDLLKLERQEQLQKHLEAGNEEETFEFADDSSRQKFYDAFKQAQEDSAEEKKRIEDEKLKNLATKNAIIERIKVLTESDETVDSINEIKQLQNDWKAIRVIPKANLQELYDRYHFYLDKFYDNFAINRELKELDRQKNLGIKIDLCNKVDALYAEPSLKRTFIMLAKYQEEFKNTGPVPREFSEEIWCNP